MNAGNFLSHLRREIRDAEKRLAGEARETPIEESPWLGDRGRSRVWLKMEHHQHTGSFKYRGALNRVRAMSASERRRGVVAASTGNHGLAVARALDLVGVEGRVIVPHGISGAKLRALRARGVPVDRRGQDCVEAELHARRLAERTGQTFLSPYNDPLVVAGQGTVGSELRRQLRDVDTVFVAVGGGGLAAGLAAALKAGRRPVRIVGCQPRNSAVMAASVRSGQLLDLPSRPTLSDGTAGGIEAGSITFPLCQRLIDEFLLVSEKEIERAMRRLIDEHHQIVEGAAAVAVAGYWKARERFRDQTVAIVLCGCNVATEVVRRVLGSSGNG